MYVCVCNTVYRQLLFLHYKRAMIIRHEVKSDFLAASSFEPQLKSVLESLVLRVNIGMHMHPEIHQTLGKYNRRENIIDFTSDSMI